LIGLQESEAAPEHPSRKHSSLIALIAALSCAGGGLYVMRTVGLSAHVALADTEIDYTIQNAMTADHSKLIDDLRRSDDIVQVPLKELPINPFAWNAVQQMEELEEVFVDNTPKEDPSERLRRERAEQVQGTFEMLTLNSVLSGSRPVVRISGETYTLGDLVEDIFVIKKVKGRTVTLSADGKTFTLIFGQ